MPARLRSSGLDEAPLVLHALGVPSLRRGGRPVALSLQRGFALLAYLAFEAGPVPREHLAALLWPDAEAAQARTRLRRLVYALDEAAGARLLSSDGDSLALVPGSVEADAPDFARFARRAVAAESLAADVLAQAHDWLERARRPLLEGLLFGSATFDDWLKAASIEHERLLARLLERVIDACTRRGEFAAAQDLAERLIALDPWREPSYVLLMQLHAFQGHSAGVEAVYARCADVLRAEFGIRPGPQTESAYVRMTEDLQRLRSNRIDRPEVRFADGPAGAIAYTVLGSGERTLVVSPGFVCHIELALEHPPLRAFVEALAGRFQVVLFDRRGIGLSERLRAASTPAALAQDIAAILDDAGVRRAWLFGSSEGGWARCGWPSIARSASAACACSARSRAAPRRPTTRGPCPPRPTTSGCSGSSRAGAARSAWRPSRRASSTTRPCARGGPASCATPCRRAAWRRSCAACATPTCAVSSTASACPRS